jgi:hypothetical protein
MALVCVKLTKSALDHTHLDVKEAILQYNPSQEKTTRKIIQKFLKKRVEDKLLVFADKRNDKLGNLLILKNECSKAGIRLKISLYCEDPENKGSQFFKEVDISEELSDMQVW